MVMQSNYPDYNKISEIADELAEVLRRQEKARYWDEEAYNKEKQLEEALEKLLMGEPVEVEGKSCKVQHCGRGELHGYHHPIYYPGKIHHLDGDTKNESFGNLALVCPKCKAHILLSRFDPEDMWLLKTRGLSNAEIGRLLGISRERVRQLCSKYETKHKTELTTLLEESLDDLVKKAESIENHLIASGRLKRRIDRRTKKKRVIAELNRLKQKADTQ
jgi:predicted transcriptional regulator